MWFVERFIVFLAFVGANPVPGPLIGLRKMKAGLFHVAKLEVENLFIDDNGIMSRMDQKISNYLCRRAVSLENTDGEYVYVA